MPVKSEPPAPKRSSAETVVQGHLTLTLPMKSPVDGEAVRSTLKSVMPDMFRAAEAMGTIHYFRFIELSVKRFVFIAEYDGDLDTVLADIGKHWGPSFDAVMAHVSQAPPTPVANNVSAFVKWAKTQSPEPFTTYEAYPGASVKTIKSLASNAGITLDQGAGSQLPLLVIMPMKSRLSSSALRLALRPLRKYLVKGADGVGTVHFAHLAQLSPSEVGFFTLYDGPFEKYVQDFASHLGPAFDFLMKFVTDPSPSPVSKRAEAFRTWAYEHDWRPIGFFNAYPGLSVQDIKALLADARASKSPSAAR